jgi:pSer/pThr/pTyr-binding forkhead associated (FHA) protein
MPVIRCPKCGQGYDIPGVIAVRLQSSIATCHCGEWLSGSKAAVLARLVDVEKVKELDLQPYRIDAAAEPPPPAPESRGANGSRSIRVSARAGDESVSTVFTIRQHPLWIGRKASHVQLGEAELSIRHCSIGLEGEDLVLRDAGSHMGTFLDGQQITRATLENGVHVLRLGSALVTVEPTEESGVPVEPIPFDPADVVANEAAVIAGLFAASQTSSAGTPARVVLICMEGLLAGQEFEVPPAGLVVGREGHVRVPDEFLSRRHFEVIRDEEGTVRVRDLGSRNGTFLNTLPAKNSRVSAGDVIQAGTNRFRIEERG